MLSLNDWNEIYEETKKGIEKSIDRHQEILHDNLKDECCIRSVKHSIYWDEYNAQLSLLDKLNEKIKEANKNRLSDGLSLKEWTDIYWLLETRELNNISKLNSDITDDEDSANVKITLCSELIKSYARLDYLGEIDMMVTEKRRVR